MATSLYDLTVASYLQVARALAGVLDKGAAHCAEQGTDTADLVAHRLAPDMADLRFQVFCVAHHSIGAIAGFRSGEFGPPSGYETLDYAGLQKVLADAIAALEALVPAEIDALAGGTVTFRLGQMEIPFTTENFALSFSLPNFYFHATTAYDLLRSKGVPLGKRDFLGQMRVGA
ncbi:MAG: DUF1993 domain-containing protein [Pseudomonadales bacterium]|jgi:hypothetical protein|nr:DUF1993 domain-containing protein [Pseudomonadales bacterium]